MKVAALERPHVGLARGVRLTVDVYPRRLQIVVECLPLYQAIELLRQPALGHVGPGLLIPVVYLLMLGLVALTWALRRLRGRLQH